MATLAKAELLKYLKDAIELESSLVAQEQIRDMYKISSEKRKPEAKYQSLPEKPKVKTKVEREEDRKNNAFVLAFFGGVTLFTGVIGLFGALCSGYDISIFVIFFLVIAIGVVLCLPQYNISRGNNRRSKTTGNKYWLDYYKRCSEINTANATIRTKYNRDLAEWTASNQRVFNYFDEKKNITKNTLNKFYEKDVIFPKYRNLPALTSIYEYILSGRCEELTGATGAYNLYEEELRKDIVIAQLNTIISNLEQIRQNQYMLYEEIKKVQRNTAVIAVELDAIRGYTAALTELTALNTFYNGIAASNSQIMAYWG